MQGWDCCSSRQPVVVCAPGPVYDWGTKAAAVLLHFIKNGICLLKVQHQYDGNVLFHEVTFLDPQSSGTYHVMRALLGSDGSRFVTQ